MIRLSKKAGSILLLLILMAECSFSQNIFDEKHSEEFANYLFNAGDYDNAAKEYLRLSFLTNKNQYKLKLLKSYRLAGKPYLEFSAFSKFYDKIPFDNKDIAAEYLKMHISAPSLFDTQTLLDKSRLIGDKTLSATYILTANILAGNYRDNVSFSGSLDPTVKEKSPVKDLLVLTDEAVKIRKKKPWLAASMSVVIPGSGKMYSGYFWDGFMSLLFTAGNAFLSYRGFSKYGTASGLGWTFASVGTFFYLGNIYGSYKAAIRKNNEKKHELQHKLKNIIDSSL